VVSRLVDTPLSVNAVTVYALVGLLVFAKDALFVGFVLPGETAAVLGGVAASRGHVTLPLIAPWLSRQPSPVTVPGTGSAAPSGHGYSALPPAPSPGALIHAQCVLARRGGDAVFLGGCLAFFAAVMPALAGASRMRYRTFLAYNAAGGLVWGRRNRSSRRRQGASRRCPVRLARPAPRDITGRG